MGTDFSTHQHPLYDECDCKDSWEHLQVRHREEDERTMISKSEAPVGYTPDSQIYVPNISPFPTTPGVTTKAQTALFAGPKVPELYSADLDTLQEVMGYLDDIARVSGVFSVEIRVKTDDVDSWAVVGYGESGDPAIIRFDA